MNRFDNERWVHMARKDKTMERKEEVGLATTARSPFAWFDEMDRVFDSFRRTFEDRFWGAPLVHWGDADGTIRVPPVDLIDQGSEFVVRAELPGVSKEDVDLTVTPEAIEVRARTNRSREEKDQDYYYQERTTQAFQRALTFPAEVKSDLAAASLKDGVLEVRVPKREPTPEAKPVKVPVA